MFYPRNGVVRQSRRLVAVCKLLKFAYMFKEGPRQVSVDKKLEHAFYGFIRQLRLAMRTSNNAVLAWKIWNF